MLITIDTDKDDHADIRAVIGFLAHLYNLEPSDETVPEGTSAPKFPQGSSTPIAAAGLPLTVPAPLTALAAATPATATSSILPASADSNVVNFPVPPPPPLADIAAIASPQTSSTSAPIAAGASIVASVNEFDSAGLPWDARIHQKARGKKKDGTWKLIKGIDDATVAAVMPELLARKQATPASPSVGIPAAPAAVPPPPPVVGAVPPPPATVAPQVFLPETGSVPVPSQQGVAAPANVPVPNAAVTTSVPVPSPPAAGAGSGAVTYRTIVDKATEGTKSGKLTAQQFVALVQSCNVPNLQQLNQMPQCWAEVDAKLELALAGLA